MSRRLLAVAALTLAAIAVVVGCQDYNFNPVGACIIQPGSRQVKLAAVSTADVLFVVDDSGSMETKQQALADSFSSFIEAVAAAQKDRVGRGLEAFEFHVAVTTSSVFRDYGTGPAVGYFTTFEKPLNPGCTTGLAVAGGPYAQGDFVAYGGNASVLHFTKNLDWKNWDPANATLPINQLIKQFVGTKSGSIWSGGNVEVGSCGSGEEQHLQGARLALQKALAGTQPGVPASEFGHLGSKLVVVFVGDEDDCSSDPANPLVLVGNPGNDSCVADKFKAAADQKLTKLKDFADYFTGLLATSGQPSALRPYDSFGAAFIVAAVSCTDGSYAPADACALRSGETAVGSGVCPYVLSSCTPDQPTTCSWASCTPSASVCQGAYAAGVRFFQLAGELRSRGSDVVEGSVCNPFGPILACVADLVTSPPKLILPTQPASGDITVVRIIDASGNQKTICQQARNKNETATAGWWFMDCKTPTATCGGPPAAAPPIATDGFGNPISTTCIYINHAGGSCEASPGDTYSAEYMGLLPQPDPQDTLNHPGGCSTPSSVPGSSQECAEAMGGVGADPASWSCYAPRGSTGRGTCVCNRSTP